MSDRRPVDLSNTELRAAARALHTICREPQDSVTDDVAYDDAVRCLFRLLHAQRVQFGWRASALTLAPWAVDVVARLICEADAASTVKGKRRMARAALPSRAAVAGGSR